MCDITEKEWNQKYLLFYNNFSKYMINYIIPDVVAFYIANSYSRKCLCDSPLYNHINSAKDVFNINCDTKKLIPKIEEIQDIKDNLNTSVQSNFNHYNKNKINEIYYKDKLGNEYWNGKLIEKEEATKQEIEELENLLKEFN